MGSEFITKCQFLQNRYKPLRVLRNSTCFSRQSGVQLTVKEMNNGLNMVIVRLRTHFLKTANKNAFFGKPG